MDMPGGVTVGNGTGVYGSVVSTATPLVVLLGNDVQRRTPGTLGAAGCAVPQHGVILGFGNGQVVRCQSPQSAGNRWARSSPDVVGSVVADFALNSSCASEVRELGEVAIDRFAASDGFNAGISALALWAGTDRDVTPSRSRLFRQSTRRPKCERKFTPMMDRATSATTNLHVKSRGKPKFRLRGSHH
jgi:hypothetical protein